MTPLRHTDLDVEQLVLSAMLFQSAAIDDGWFLKPEHFHDGRHRRIFEALKAVQNAGETVDTVAVASYLKDQGKLQQVGGTPYLAELVEGVPGTVHLERHAQRLVQLWRLREAQATLHRLSAELDTDDLREDFLDHAQAEIFRACSETDASKEAASLYGDSLSEVFRETQEASRGPAVRGAPTGLTQLDTHTGGLSAPDLWYVAGRPGMGKTSLALQVAELVARDSLVVFFSLEMSRSQLAQRGASREAYIPLTHLRSGRLADGAWGRLATTVEKLGNLALLVDETPRITPAALRSKLRRHLAQLNRRFYSRKLGLVVVDHVQLMRGDARRYESRNDELTDISGLLKLVAKEFNTPVWALSQLRRPRDARDRRPTLNSLRESGALEQDADAVLFIHREDEYRKVEDRDGKAELILAKGRSCGSNDFEVSFDGRFTRFRDNSEVPEAQQDHFPGFQDGI